MQLKQMSEISKLEQNLVIKNIDKETIENYKKEIKKYKPVEMEIDELIKSAPKRTIPIEKYLTDNDWGIWWNDKYRFGLLR